MRIHPALIKVLAVVGAFALALIVVGGIGGFVIMRNGFSARDTPSMLEAWVARSVREASIPTRAAQLQNPVKSSGEVLRDARAHWADHCASCHANNGSGETSMGKNMYPKPPDMRQQPTQRLTDGELYYVIQNGIRLTGMPAWGEPVEDDKESWGLVTFIRHLPSLTPAEEEEMKNLNPKSVHELEEHRMEEEFLNEQTEPDSGGKP